MSPCTGCPDTVTVNVTDPRGSVTRYTHGNRWRANEGQLLGKEEDWNAGTGTAQRSTSYTYRSPTAGIHPEWAGIPLPTRSDSYASNTYAPQNQRTTTLQGSTFTWQATGFDARARPTVVSKSSSLPYSRTETTVYEDNLSKWVLGLTKSVTVSGGGLAGPTISESHDYDPTTANRVADYSFGRLLQTWAYYADGTLYSRTDPAGRATTYESYMRGLARTIRYPNSTSESAAVGNLGLIESHTNAAGTTTQYQYDAMGRLTLVTYPGGDPAAYYQTALSFAPSAAAARGLPAGFWLQTITTGASRTENYFDALWRLRLSRTFDTGNPGGTARTVQTRYDIDGRTIFESTPQRDIAGVDTTVYGKAWSYDKLGRVVQQLEDSELGLLTTTTEYLGNFQKRVTNPRGLASVFSYQAFDQPSEDAIAGISAPEGVSVSIPRDAFGKPNAITRSGTWAGSGVSATRSYVYDGNHRLCKTIEPETGATVQYYDTAGNLAWRASGQSFTGTGSCDQSSVPGASKISFGYDTRNRLTSTAFGDGRPTITRSYTPDSLLQQVVAGSFTWTYDYYNRRALKQEMLSVPGQQPGQGWNFTWGVDAHGSVSSLSDPWGTMNYAPNALGEPTTVSGYASGVSYHPNGAVAGYTLANGVARTVDQNIRGLPWHWQDAGVVGVINDVYTYDANGNVTAILDQQENVSSRSMGYDGLDRLTTASGVWGSGGFGYDGLDNLRSSQVGARTLGHNIDPATNRLTSLSGSQSVAMSYDANGNVVQRGGQGYSFDIANRLRNAWGKASYDYDGHGRRGWIVWIDGSTQLNAYSGTGSAGKLLFSNHSTKGATRYVYLGDKLIAEHSGQSGAVTYSHTDALGSPVARTNSAGQVISLSRTRYEPYGATAAGMNPDGIGFTGHVNDPDTGLVYMQQRYYDPIAGWFLSVDPVTTNAKDGSFFGRYHYANDNPYKFVDPDGRAGALAACAAGPVGCAVGVVVTIAVGAKAISDTAKILQSTSSSSNAGSGQQGGDKAPSVPDKLVGTVDDKSGQQGNRVNNGPLAPENGGTGDAAKDFGKLTGGKIGESGKYPGVRGENGIGMRPGKEGEGPRIDIPANGNKPAETLHYPKPEPT